MSDPNNTVTLQNHSYSTYYQSLDPTISAVREYVNPFHIAHDTSCQSAAHCSLGFSSFSS